MYKRFLKRFLDFFIALLVLPFLLIATIIVGLLIIIDDGFPIFYNGKRIGKNGKLFKMYKFRTMKNNSPDIRLKDGSTYNAENDPRVTRLGKVLRKTSIDELLQFLNILKGDMSLVGPRPDTPDSYDKYIGEYKNIFNIRPGITGYNQAYYRNSIDANEKILNDVKYVKNYSFIMDLKIFLKTIISVFYHKNVFVGNSKNVDLDTDNARMLKKLKTNNYKK